MHDPRTKLSFRLLDDHGLCRVWEFLAGHEYNGGMCNRTTDSAALRATQVQVSGYIRKDVRRKEVSLIWQTALPKTTNHGLLCDVCFVAIPRRNDYYC